MARSNAARAARPPLALSPKRAKSEDPFEAHNTIAEMNVEHMGRQAVRLSCSVVWRDHAIANGKPVQARIELPDYEREEGSCNRTDLVVQLDDAEELLEAMLAVVREAKRLGFAGPERPAT